MILDGSHPTDPFILVFREGIGLIGMVERIDTHKDEIIRFVHDGSTYRRITERWSDGFYMRYRAP